MKMQDHAIKYQSDVFKSSVAQSTCLYQAQTCQCIIVIDFNWRCWDKSKQKTSPASNFKMTPGGKQKQILTIIIIVDSHISRCCVHDLSWVCRERLLVAQWQQVALFLELFNQLQRDGNKGNMSRRHITGGQWDVLASLQGPPLSLVYSQ